MTYPELLGQLHQLTEANEAVQWTQAELVAQALALPGVTPSQLAHDLGCSKSHVRRLAKTYATFSTAAQRWQAPNATFSHHRICAESDNPRAWLAACAEEEWSTRDLQVAIKAQQAEDLEALALREADQAIARLRSTFQQATPAIQDYMRAILTVWWKQVSA